MTLKLTVVCQTEFLVQSLALCILFPSSCGTFVTTNVDVLAGEEFDEFTKLEIQQRIRSKMSKRSYIDAASINIDVSFERHSYKARVTFKRNDSNTVYGISIESDGVEVIVE